jgi:hypothetical protein
MSSSPVLGSPTAIPGPSLQKSSQASSIPFLAQLRPYQLQHLLENGPQLLNGSILVLGAIDRGACRPRTTRRYKVMSTGMSTGIWRLPFSCDGTQSISHYHYQYAFLPQVRLVPCYQTYIISHRGT